MLIFNRVKEMTRVCRCCGKNVEGWKTMGSPTKREDGTYALDKWICYDCYDAIFEWAIKKMNGYTG